MQRKRSARGDLVDDDDDDDYDDPSSLYREASNPQSASRIAVTSLDGAVGHASHAQIDSLQDEEVHNPTAVDVFGPQHVTGPTDAMQSLIHAAGLLKNQLGQDFENDKNGSSNSNATRSGGQGFHPNRHERSTHNRTRDNVSRSPLLDPAITTSAEATPEPSQQTVKVWSRLRFVRAGWFTAKEAAQYVE